MADLGTTITKMCEKIGEAQVTIRVVEGYARKHNASLEDACEVLDLTYEQYEEALDIIAQAPPYLQSNRSTTNE